MHKLRLIIFAVIAVTVFSCRSNEKKKIQNKSATTVSNNRINNPVTEDFAVTGAHLQEFKTFLKGLDENIIDNATVAAQKFQDLFKGEDALTRDTALILFNKFDVSLADKADAAHGRDTTIQYDSLLTDSNGIHSNKISAKTAQYDKLLKTNGLRVASEEGETFIVQDLDFEIKWLKDKLSAPLQQYLTESAKEDKEGLAEDAGLVITPKKLAERAIWWENFLKNNPATIVSVQAKYNWDGDVEILLTGMDNTPVLLYNPFSFEDNYAEAFQYLQNTWPDSDTNKIINPFYKLAVKKDSIGIKKLLDEYKTQGIISQMEASHG